VREAFAVRRRASVAGRTVTLVDDVVTTGATALACAGRLAEAGAREVRLLSVARVA
jgi:predicted amidophosphoribosyltransferase